MRIKNMVVAYFKILFWYRL